MKAETAPPDWGPPTPRASRRPSSFSWAAVAAFLLLVLTLRDRLRVLHDPRLAQYGVDAPGSLLAAAREATLVQMQGQSVALAEKTALDWAKARQQELDQQRVSAARLTRAAPIAGGAAAGLRRTGGSPLHKQSSAELARLLDETSMMSPLRLCAADGLTLDVRPEEAQQLLLGGSTRASSGSSSGGSDDPALLVGVARGLPCAAAAAAGGACCERPLAFRQGTPDYAAFQQVFQCHSLRFLYSLMQLEPPRTVLDAGAGGGYTALLFKLLWPQAKVVALEPQPAAYALLRHNTARLKDVVALNAGLWGRSGNLTQLPAPPGAAAARQLYREAKEGEQGVRGYSVQDVAALAGVESFDFVHLDIEGAEAAVLSPAADLRWVAAARAVALAPHSALARRYGLTAKAVSAQVAAAFKGSHALVSDGRHLLYLSAALQQAAAALQPPSPLALQMRTQKLRSVAGCEA